MTGTVTPGPSFAAEARLVSAAAALSVLITRDRARTIAALEDARDAALTLLESVDPAQAKADAVRAGRTEIWLDIRRRLVEGRANLRDQSHQQTRRDAEDLYSDCQRLLPANSTVLASARNVRDQWLRRATDDIQRGIDLYRINLDLCERAFKASAYQTCMSRANLAVALREKGTHEAAKESLELLRADEPFRRDLVGDDHPFMWVARMGKAQTLFALAGHEPDHASEHLHEAEEIARDVAARRTRILGPHHTGTIRAVRLVGRCLLAQGHAEQAVIMLSRAKAAEDLSGNAYEPGRTLLFLAQALAATGKTSDLEPALARARQALETLQLARGAEVSETQSAAELVADLEVRTAGLFAHLDEAGH